MIFMSTSSVLPAQSWPQYPELSICTSDLISIDHSPFRKTFELGIFISTAEKSILNLVKLANFVYFCIRREKV